MNARRASRFVFFVALALLAAFAALAHDPYEITSEARLYSDRTTVEIEMEYRTALRLSGVETQFGVSPAEQLAANLERVKNLAGGFFLITAPDGVLVARATNVTLGVEGHAQFRLDYSAAQTGGLRFDAQGLRSAATDDPYGTTLVVLDMVNKTVLGQAVLFAASSRAEFMVATNLAIEAPGAESRETQAVSLTQEDVIRPASAPAPPAVRPAPKYGRWLVLVAVLFCVVVLAWSWRRE